MGYRSDIKFIIRGPREAITAFLVATRLELPEPPSSEGGLCWGGIKTIYKKNGEAFIFFEAEDYKWYEAYPDVAFYEAFWTAASEFDDVLDGKFVRLGEDDDDMERRGFGLDSYKLMQIRRSVEVYVDLTNEEDV